MQVVVVVEKKKGCCFKMMQMENSELQGSTSHFVVGVYKYCRYFFLNDIKLLLRQRIHIKVHKSVFNSAAIAILQIYCIYILQIIQTTI